MPVCRFAFLLSVFYGNVETALSAFVLDVAAVFPFQVTQDHGQYHFQLIFPDIQGVFFIDLRIADPRNIECRTILVGRIDRRIGVSFL